MKYALYILCILFSFKQVAGQELLNASWDIPTFVNAGDKPKPSIVITNPTANEYSGWVSFSCLNVRTQQPIDGWLRNFFPTQYFTVEANKKAVLYFPIEIPFDLYDSVCLQAIIHASLNGSLPSFSITRTLKIYTGHIPKMSVQTIPIKKNITSLHNEWAMFTKEEEATNVYQWFLGVFDAANPPTENSFTNILSAGFSINNQLASMLKSSGTQLNTKNNNLVQNYNCKIIKEGSYDTITLNNSGGLHYTIWEMPPFKKTDNGYLFVNSLTAKLSDSAAIVAFLGKNYFITNNHPSIKKLPIIKTELLFKNKKVTTQYQAFECQIGDTLSLIYTLPVLGAGRQLQHSIPAGFAYLNNNNPNIITVNNGMVGFKKLPISKKLVQYQITLIAKQKGAFVLGYGYVYNSKKEPIAQLETKFNIVIE